MRYRATTREPSRRNRSCIPAGLDGEQPKQPPSSGKPSSTPSGAGTASGVPDGGDGRLHHGEERLALRLREIVVELNHAYELGVGRELNLLEVRSDRLHRSARIVGQLEDVELLHEPPYLVGEHPRLQLLQR